MAKPEWGIKRICPNCGARYYDLHKEPPVCPSCGTVFDPEALLKSRRARPAPVEDLKKVAPELEEEELELEPEEAVEDEVDVEDLEEEADEVVQEDEDVLIEDASELGEDDDMGDVVDVDTEDEER